jgi:hypothetical protein
MKNDPLSDGNKTTSPEITPLQKCGALRHRLL